MYFHNSVHLFLFRDISDKCATFALPNIDTQIMTFRLTSATLLFLSILGLFFSCTYENLQESSGTVCFERDVQPILAANCAYSGCHNAIDRAQNRDFTAYQDVLKEVEPGNYKKSELYEVLVESNKNDVMPPAPYNRLSSADIATIAAWIEAGAPNQSCGTTTVCDTAGVVSYSAKVVPILTRSCNTCHGGAAQAGNGITLSTYAGVKKMADEGRLIGSITHDSRFSAMPKNANKLSDCNIAIIRKWVNAGAPNN
jgi:mono/diheme cytochrome c family protein